MKNSLCTSLLFLLLLLSKCLPISAQDYRVIGSVQSYKHTRNGQIAISVGDTLHGNDIISIKNEKDAKGQQIIALGSLEIKLPSGKTRKVARQHIKQKLDDIFFPSYFSKISKLASQYLSGFFKLKDREEKPAVHLQGKESCSGLEVSFISCDSNKVYSIPPINIAFDIQIVNHTDSIMYAVVACKSRKSKMDSAKPTIVRSKPDGDPIVLVPGETVTIPSPWRLKNNFSGFHLSIFGSSRFFDLKYKDDSSFWAYADNVIELPYIKRYYYYTNEK